MTSLLVFSLIGNVLLLALAYYCYTEIKIQLARARDWKEIAERYKATTGTAMETAEAYRKVGHDYKRLYESMVTAFESLQKKVSV